MELIPKYLTFDEYEDIGGDLNESLFNILEYRAEKKVDLYTFNRFRKGTITSYPQELKMCVYDLLELVRDDNSTITSESVGSYSVTRKTMQEINNNIQSTVKEYLSNVIIDGIPAVYIGADEN